MVNAIKVTHKENKMSPVLIDFSVTYGNESETENIIENQSSTFMKVSAKKKSRDRENFKNCV